ncbi:MAG: preprotein translocase subunit SecG [Proteobacteria bacterium]|nr:preprotein translocase subunit SecG [Pseudomonadota bacterium]MBU1715308.1 preprotein translocase subunit SecG [Pseudomonadota bacterium]
MDTILTVVHLTVCFFLIVLVLLQHGKGADIGATFGGSSNTVFGSEGPVPMLNKITTAAAIIFMLTSISLAYLSAHVGSGSVMRKFQAPVPAPTMPLENTTEQGPISVPMPDAGADNSEQAPAQFPGQEKTDN